MLEIIALLDRAIKRVHVDIEMIVPQEESRKN